MTQIGQVQPGPSLGTQDVSDRAARLLGRASEYFSSIIENGSGQVASPGAGVVLADTGPLAAGQYKIQVVGSSVAGLAHTGVEVQHRNAANGANITTWAFANPVNAITELVFVVNLALNERVRVVTLLALTTTVQVTITAEGN